MLLICFVTDCGTADTTQNITTQSLRLFLFWCQRPASRLPQVFFEAFPQNEPFRLTFPTHSYLAYSASYSCPGVAQYWLSFYGNWSAATHPSTFPSTPTNGFFSPLVGASQEDTYTMWDAGMLASAGIKAVAETGELFILQQRQCRD